MERREGGPAGIILSRQNLPVLEGTSAEGVDKGGYVLIRDRTCRLFGYHGLMAPDGRFFAGTMDEERMSRPQGALYRLDPGGSCTRVIDGLIVSNHGGRQLDTVPGACTALPGVVAAIQGQTEILLDGGVRLIQNFLQKAVPPADARIQFEARKRHGWNPVDTAGVLKEMQAAVDAAFDPAALTGAFVVTYKGRIIADVAPRDILAIPGQSIDEVDASGLAVASMTDPQRAIVERLLGVYAGNLRQDLAKQELQRIAAAGIGHLRFAWMGSDKPGEGHYYRLSGPTFVIEYDNTQGGANHVHTVWRDRERDFGRDLLKEHHEHDHPHR